MRKVFVDTSVLFPFSVMDLFLALAEDRAHRVLWTDELLDEWERVIVREQHRTRASAAAVTAAIRESFDDTRIDPSTYRDRVGDMPGPDPDDHVHSAAALAANATELITWETSGFPADELAKLGLRVIDPDTYLVELLNDLGGQVTGNHRECRPLEEAPTDVERWSRPPAAISARRVTSLVTTTVASAMSAAATT